MNSKSASTEVSDGLYLLYTDCVAFTAVKIALTEALVHFSFLSFSGLVPYKALCHHPDHHFCEE